ncbi:MAG TPA: hypothetical protein VMB27_21655 [Solirubrobacteraceae bacterium]|nr:hypothetical protein [Solirubrobacteraceae bacterium]
MRSLAAGAAVALASGVGLASGVALASSASGATGPAWPAASELTLPANASTTPNTQQAEVTGVSCAEAGNCLAGGFYIDMTGLGRAMVASEADGTWGQAGELTLPANAATTPGSAVDGVSCTSAGHCVAGGSYIDPSSASLAMVASETNGTWGQASELTLPSNALTTSMSARQIAEVEGVSCAYPGNCVAVGSYTDTSGGEQPMVASETDGAWGQAGELTLPANADTTSGRQYARVDAVSCPGAGNCLAVGDYFDTSGTRLAMVASETDGIWGPAGQLTLPANALPATTTTFGGQNASVGGVSCTSVGNCVAGGQYTDARGVARPMIASETDGIWGQAGQLTLPPNAATIYGSGIGGISCPSAGNCVAGGSYVDTGGTEQAMVASETDGTWGQAGELTLPANALTTATPSLGAQRAGVQGVSCVSVASCVIGGIYRDTSGAYQGMVDSSVPMSVSTTGLPPGAVGSSVGSTSATVGNQRITLTIPSLCVAPSSKLTVRFASTRLSYGVKLRFKSAAFYMDKGVRHRADERVQGKVKVATVYLANATRRHQPASLHLSVAKLKGGTNTLRVVVSYARTVRRHGHKATVTVTKTLRVKFSVC